MADCWNGVFGDTLFLAMPFLAELPFLDYFLGGFLSIELLVL